MSHNHSHGSHDHSHETAGKNIMIVFVLNLLFAVVEIVGGIMTNSMAIISDAIHDIGDSVSLGIAWYLEKVSGKGRDKNFSYGYKRFSLLGAVIISVILCVGSIIVISECVGRLMEPQQPDAKGMFFLAIAGIVVNGAAVFRIKKGKTMNERAVYLHLMEDVMGWAAVFVVSIVMMFTDAPYLDPILSICIAVWVLSNVFKNIKNTFRVLLQGTPVDMDEEQIRLRMMSIEGVASVHDIHLWTLDGQSNIVTLHIVCREDTSPERQRQIKSQARELCHSMNIDHATIEIESDNECCELLNH